eukprot:CAMPEP_0115323374 /NCGR_PEP_ID=MMETSP0270-20121206/81909_1 /TAXON_ID=71861 /ORGANISM="Scrippsiella trochoidea, Strain CCMP3099" /LENGTH=33 /DNA_ID= /DNA_START= /DNA_END= /DNA_ORIENTATION=
MLPDDLDPEAYQEGLGATVQALLTSCSRSDTSA